MKTRSTMIVLLAMAALCCLPATAAARPSPDRPPANRWLDVDLEGSNGYSIHISVNPRQRLTLLVTKEGYAAEYLTRDVLPDTDRVKARLLGRGVISLRFNPRGAVRHPDVRGCGKARPPVQPGIVRGTIKFVGERRYTRVKAHEAEAAIEEPVGWECRFGVESEWDRRRLDWTSKLSANIEGVYFLARRYRPGVLGKSQVLYLAETGETFETDPGQPPLTVWRRASVSAPVSTFRDARPETLTTTPPPPFSGTAAIARTPESVFTWEGDLAVQFPGLDLISLAGPDYRFDYCLREVGCLRQDVADFPGPGGEGSPPPGVEETSRGSRGR